ncbi:MAG: hypothetical protein Q7T01_00030 [bacterium]|nr:hypothetical protein [bacterium]
MRIVTRLALPVAALMFLGAGCISFSGSGADGGIFLSKDRGEAWEQRGAVLSVGGGQSLAPVNVLGITQDPNDPLALYTTTEANGAYASWDGGASWQLLGSSFAQSRTSAVGLHPTDRCTIIIAGGQRVYRTKDCGRHWDSSVFEANVSMTALAMDPVAPSVVYAGNSRGDILLSTDSGASWRTMHRAENPIRQLIAVRTGGSSFVIAVTSREGLLRSMTRGATWESLRKGMESFPAAFNTSVVVPVAERPGELIHASQYGLLRSRDAGSTWEAIPLLTEAGSVTITAAAVDPADRDRIVYATRSTFYRTSDSGRTWETRKLPTSRLITGLLIDRRSSDAVWMSTRQVKE